MWDIEIEDGNWDRQVFGSTLYSVRLMWMDYSEAEARDYFAEKIREYIPQGAEYATLTRNNYWQGKSETIVRWVAGDDVPDVEWDKFCVHGHRWDNGCDECDEDEG